MIATKTETMKYFAECVYLAENLQDYNSHIQEAIDNDTEALAQKRISVAKSHTCEVSVNKILELIN